MDSKYNEIEETVLSLICQELGVSGIAADESFNTLGIGSIQGLTILSQLEDKLQVELEESLIWNSDNVWLYTK
jgi:acyl carrier protein